MFSDVQFNQEKRVHRTCVSSRFKKVLMHFRVVVYGKRERANSSHL